MAEINLKQKFPRMEPISKAPTLYQANGCGVGLYGRRDEDAETGTYVATWCVSLLYIPLLALRAYRVSPAGDGTWYFIGREPLSGFAKLANLILVAVIAGGIGLLQYNAYTSTPAYKAKRQMASAQKMVEQGRLTDAAAIYQGLANAAGEQAGEAAGALVKLMDEQCQQAKLSEAAGVFTCAAEVARRRQQPTPAEVAAKGRALVAVRGNADPAGGVAVLDAVRPLVLDTRDVDARRLALLQKWAAAEPGNLNAIVPLASLLDESDKPAEAKKLLLPVKDKLGDGEGARVLGVILGRDGDYDGAYAMLWPYTKTRLDKLHSAEKGWEATLKRLHDRELNLLRTDKGPADFYKRYDAAPTDDAKAALVDEHMSSRLKNDSEYLVGLDAMREAARVVPVALELGIVMLQRAQGQTDPAARKSQLEAAEQTFLAVRGVAGETDEYRMWLAQVYYWLGKQDEGRKLFDEYLVSKGRAHADLIQIGSTLRQLGAEGEARELAEEAYKKATKAQERYDAAQLRHLLFKDNDDKIEWLTRGNQTDPNTKAALALAMGDRAREQGKDEEAAGHYRKALAAYESMPRSSSSLNQSALAYYSIFLTTGDDQALSRCTDTFQQAVELDPSDTVLLYNAGVTLLDAALADVIGDEIDLRALRRTASVDMLGYLYGDQAGREVVAAELKAHPGVARAMAYLEKVTVLAPKGVNANAALFVVYQFTRNEAMLRKLDERVRAAGLDTADQLETTKRYMSGERDAQSVERIKASLKRTEELVARLRTKGGRTAAVALCEHADLIMRLDGYGVEADLDQAVALAQEAVTFSRSADTLSTLSTARLHHAARDLRKTNPEFDAFYKKFQRSIGTSNVVAAAASEPGPFQAAVLKHPDVRQAITLALEDAKLFKEGNAPFEWALVKNANPAEAKRMADTIRATPRRRVEQSIRTTLAPTSPANAIDTYWFHQVLGEPDNAKAALRKVVEAGIPMPVQP